MTRHVVIGTAGHVDHGKSALVLALTGTDPDRWAEEKRRGITIDLGFAHLPLTADLEASIVDVPGHEDFVRNMVAGATGVDVALLVVAADEGVMPQTIEHLAILELLGIRNGVVAVTKADLAQPDWLELVFADVTDRIEATSIAWEPPVAVSALEGLFRLPVDRAFSLAGAGTVVTGTTWSGTVATGDEVVVLPQGIPARVRSVQVHGETRPRAEPGRRTALALPGVDRHAVARGSVVVADPSWRPVSALDAQVTLLPNAPRPLSQRSRVRCHLGTAEVIGRVTPAGDAIAPGQTGLVRLRLDEPVVARWGDRIILRAYSPVTTIGGAVVVDPWPAPRPRRPVADPRRAGTDVIVRILAVVESRGAAGVAQRDLMVRAGVPRGDLASAVTEAIRTGAVACAGDTLLSADVVRELRGRATGLIAEHHEQHPLAPGMPLEMLRKALGDSPAGAAVLSALPAGGEFAIEGGVARLSTHRPTLDARQSRDGEALLLALRAGGPEGRAVAELEHEFPPGIVASLMAYYVRQGTAIRVGPERYYHRAELDAVVRQALETVRRLGQATVPQVRDALGLTRKYLIPLLEWLDQRGFTARAGDARRLTPVGERYVRDTASELDAVSGGP